MSVRVPVALGALLGAGCGLVSGLDSLSVEGGSALPDVADASTEAIDDAFIPPPADVGTESGARAGSALQSKGGCATTPGATTLALSNDNFTIELWLRVDGPSATTQLAPILWKGGRASVEPGWTLALQGGSLVFCVSDGTSAKCTSGYAMAIGHLVHVAIKSQYSSGFPSSRNVNVYARDVSNNELTHTAAGNLTSGGNSWTTSAELTIGGASTNNACAAAPSFTIDDVRIYSNLQSLASMDNNMSVDVSCGSAGLLADYKFNEGAGAVANDCSPNAYDLTLGQNQAFVPSPFP